MNRQPVGLMKNVVTLVFFSVFLMLVAVPFDADAAVPGLVEQTSHSGFDRTVQHLKRAIASNGLMIITTQDHQMMLGMVGVHAQKALGFEVFHPKFGKIIYANDPTAYLAVPLHILVQEHGSKVVVIYRKPSAVLGNYDGLGDLGQQLDRVFARIEKEAIQ
ncbi:MAG: DUF302 domain-containing protein [Nitrospirota bacterium]|nr:DUF302 domain-containing protein [Nitrospirota bacterium]